MTRVPKRDIERDIAETLAADSARGTVKITATR